MSYLRKMIVLVLIGTFAYGDNGVTTPGETPLQNRMSLTPTAPLANGNIPVTIDAELLYLFAKMQRFSYATRFNSIIRFRDPEPANSKIIWVPGKQQVFGTKWDPGVRTAVSVKLPYDNWDMHSAWTYFYNSKEERLSYPPFKGNIMDPPNATPVGLHSIRSKWTELGFDADELYTSLQAKWSVQLNQWDLDLGRSFWISRYLALRPYFGLRGHSSNLHLNFKGNLNETITAVFSNVTTLQTVDLLFKYKTSLWGVGPLFGMKGAWYFAREWSLLGEIGGAVMYGLLNAKNSIRYIETSKTDQSSVDDYASWQQRFKEYQLQSVIDFALGLSWERFFYGEKNQLKITLAWENHIYPSLATFVYPYRNQEGGNDDVQGSGDTASYTLSTSGVRASVQYTF